MSALRSLALFCLLVATGCRRQPTLPVSSQGADTPRIVSLAPSLTEIIFALEAENCLVGRTDVCNWPPEARKLPVAGHFGRPFLETILRLRPTHVLTADLEDKRSIDALQSAGVQHRRIPCIRLADIPIAIRELGALTGRDDHGEKLASDLERQLQALRNSTATNPAPLVFVEIWGDPLMTAGRRSFVSELITLSGGRNLGDEVDADYFTVAPDWVLQRDPDVILCLYMTAGGRAAHRVAQRPGWHVLQAVQKNRIYDNFNADTVFRPGPRVMEGIQALRHVLKQAAGASRF